MKQSPYQPPFVKFASFVLALAIATLSTLPADAQRIERRTLELDVGEQTSVPGTDVVNYSEGTPGIVDVRVSAVRGNDPRFVLVALQPGSTTLLLILNSGRQVQYAITVRDPDASPTGIQERSNVRLDLYFVQISESGSYQIGLAWPTSIGGDGIASLTANVDLVAGEVVQGAALVTGHPLPRLDLLQSSGWARMMRHVSLVTANANTARYSSGNEVNIPIVGSQSAELRQIFFGSTVEVLPRFDEETSRVELRVNASVSDIADDRGTGIPGRVISESETLVNLAMGEAMVLAGAVTESNTYGRSGLAGLSQIPILGVLFGSHVSRQESVQNALFIIPSVVDSVDAQVRSHIDSALDLYWSYDGDIEERELLAPPAGIPSALPSEEDES